MKNTLRKKDNNKVLNYWLALLLIISMTDISIAEMSNSKICSELINADSEMEELALIKLIDAINTESLCEGVVAFLIKEESDLYRDRGTKATNRIRSYSFYKLAGIPSLQEELGPLTIAELSATNNAYTFAYIAKSIIDHDFLLQYSALPGLLEQAYERILYRDLPLTFDEYFPIYNQTHEYTSAKKVLTSASKYIKSRQVKSCCSIAGIQKMKPSTKKVAVKDLNLIDQAGNTINFKSYFRQPTVVAFFYSRCDNPFKCSATVTKMGHLQSKLTGTGVQLACITYDPRYDHPEIISEYGKDRGLVFNDKTKMFTYAADAARSIQDFFKLKVNYNSSIVTIHSIELFITDNNGELIYSNYRQDWSVEEVYSALKENGMLARL